MKEKNTGELFSEIQQTEEIHSYLKDNKKSLHYPTIAEFLNKVLQDKGMTKKELIEESNLDRVYVYQILSGVKTAPSRAKLLSLAIALKLSLDETQHLLKYGKVPELYPRDSTDSVIIYAIKQQLSLHDTNELLNELGLKCLSQ